MVRELHELALGEEGMQRTLDVAAAAGVEAVNGPAEARDAHDVVDRIIGVPPVEALAGAHGDAVRLDAAHEHEYLECRASVGTSGLGHGRGPGGRARDRGQAVDGDGDHDGARVPRAPVGCHADGAVGHVERGDRRVELDGDAIGGHRLGEGAPTGTGAVCQTGEQTAETAVPGDRADRVDDGTGLRRCAAHQLPPAEQEVAHGGRRLEIIDVPQGGAVRPREGAGAVGLGIGGDLRQCALERRQLIPRHGQALAQLAGGTPACV